MAQQVGVIDRGTREADAAVPEWGGHPALTGSAPRRAGGASALPRSVLLVKICRLAHSMAKVRLGLLKVSTEPSAVPEAIA